MIKIRRYTALLLALCAMFSFLTACTIQPGYEGAPEGMRPINEGREGALLFVPIDWTVETSTGVPTAYFSSNDRTTVTLVTVKAATLGERDAKAYFESYIEGFKNTITDFKFVKEKEEDPDYTTRLIAGVGAYIYTYSGKVAELDYKFRQAILKNPTSGDLYIITYSSAARLFDEHTDALKDIYDNFKFTTEILPMDGKTEVEDPSTDGVNVPDGMKLVSSVNTDYHFFVKNDWIPTVTTGMTAAHSPSDANTTVSCTVFTTNLADYDEYWTGYEKDIKNTFGDNIQYESEAKFTEAKICELPARVYNYSVEISGTRVYYSQSLLIRAGQVYIITCASDSFESAKEINFELRLK